MHVKPNSTDVYNRYNKIPIIVFINLNHTVIIRTTQQIGHCGTALQTGRSRVRFLMV